MKTALNSKTTALVLVDPQIDVLSPDGVMWDLVGEQVKERGIVAKLRRLTLDPAAVVPTPAEAWSAITRGNADALGWTDAGRLEAGASADLLLLRPPLPRDEHLIGRLLYTWRNAYIAHRVLAGNLV